MTAEGPGGGGPTDESSDAFTDGFTDDPLGRLRDRAGDDPRIQAGVEHLQRAAHEAIAASRALLDVAEELVADPRALGSLLGALGSVGDLAARLGGVSRTAGPVPRSARPPEDIDGDPDDDEPPVQRIPVS